MSALTCKERKMLETEEFYKQYEDKIDDYRERDYPRYTYNPMSNENLDRLTDMLVRVLEFHTYIFIDYELTINEKKLLSNILIDWYNEEDPKLEDFVDRFYYKVFKKPISNISKSWLYLIFDRMLVTHFDDDIFWTIKNPFVIGYYDISTKLPRDLIPDKIFENSTTLGIYLDLLSSPNVLLEKTIIIMNKPEFEPFHHDLVILYKNIINYEKDIIWSIHYYPIRNSCLDIGSIPDDVGVFIGNKDYPQWREQQRKEREERHKHREDSMDEHV